MALLARERPARSSAFEMHPMGSDPDRAHACVALCVEGRCRLVAGSMTSDTAGIFDVDVTVDVLARRNDPHVIVHDVAVAD